MDRQTAMACCRRYRLLWSAGVALLCGCGNAAAQGAGVDASRARQRSVAVNEFEWAAAKTPAQAIFKTNVDVGKGVQAVMVQRLVEGGKIRVIERKNLDVLTNEQDLGGSNRTKSGMGARVGRGYGADVYLFGDILVFGRDDKKVSFSGGGFGFGLPGGALLDFGKKEDKAVVVIAYRLVDVETQQVISSGQARGESRRKSKGLAGLGITAGGIAGAAIDMTSSNFKETIIGEAVTDATDKLALIVNEKIPNLPRRERYVEALVADVSENQLTLNRGSADGIEVGDRFEVFRVVKEIKDPLTDEVLDKDVARLGDLLVVSVRDKIAVGTYTGSGATRGNTIARKIVP